MSRWLPWRSRAGFRRPLSSLHVSRRSAKWTSLLRKLLHDGSAAGVCVQPRLQRCKHTPHHILLLVETAQNVFTPPCLLPQVPGARRALRVISGTRWCPAAAARPAGATTTSKCTTPAHVTPRQAPVSGACTTPRALRASTAKRVTMATRPLKAVGVSVLVSVPR